MVRGNGDYSIPNTVVQATAPLSCFGRERRTHSPSSQCLKPYCDLWNTTTPLLLLFRRCWEERERIWVPENKRFNCLGFFFFFCCQACRMQKNWLVPALIKALKMQSWNSKDLGTNVTKMTVPTWDIQRGSEFLNSKEITIIYGCGRGILGNVSACFHYWYSWKDTHSTYPNVWKPKLSVFRMWPANISTPIAWRLGTKIHFNLNKMKHVLSLTQLFLIHAAVKADAGSDSLRDTQPLCIRSSNTLPEGAYLLNFVRRT